MNKRTTYSAEVRERAVRMVLTSEHDHPSRWAALVSIASKIGCTPETLRAWVIVLRSIQVNELVLPPMPQPKSSNLSAKTKSLSRPTRS